ncbi:hypothetical protein BsWGS_10483 [Bradybaena similaris]
MPILICISRILGSDYAWYMWRSSRQAWSPKAVSMSAQSIDLPFVIVAVLAKKSAYLFPFMPPSRHEDNVIFPVLEFNSNSSHCLRITSASTLWNMFIKSLC